MPVGLSSSGVFRNELCVKSRSEIITFRNAVLEFSFLKDVSLVDNVRRLEAELVRFRQILADFYRGPQCYKGFGPSGCRFVPAFGALLVRGMQTVCSAERS